MIACTLVAGYCFAQQKRPLDIKACTSWNRIDNPNISPTGRYATYKIVPTETSYSESGKIPVMLFDSKTRKYINLGNVDGINYFNYDKQLFYMETDTADNEFTYIVDLPSGKKRLWNHPEALEPIGITNFTASRLQIPEDKDKGIKSHANLIIRNLAKNDSVCIENIMYHSIYNNDRSLIFVQEKGDKRAIKYGPLMGPYKTLIERDKASIPSSFSFDSSTLTGQYDINESVYCSFDLNKRTVDTIFSVSEIPVPAGKQIARMNLMKNHNYVMVQFADANHAAAAAKKEEKKKDESKDMLEKMKEMLGGRVKEVRISQRLKSNPVCLAVDGDVSIEMERVMNSMPIQEKVESQKVLEINPDHPVFDALTSAFKSGDDDKLRIFTSLLYDQAALIGGLTVEDPVAFSNHICDLMK